MKKLITVLFLAAVSLMAQPSDQGLAPCTSVTGTNTITCKIPFMTAYPNNWTIEIVPANSNTGAATINVNSLGAIPIQDAGNAIVANRLIANRPQILRCGTAACQISSTPGAINCDPSSGLCTAAALTITGAITPTGGTAQVTVSQPYTAFTTWAANPSVATNTTTLVNGTIWWSQLYIPVNATLTGACMWNVVGATDKYIYILFNSAGSVVANSATAGTTAAGSGLYQCIPFTGTVAVTGPQTYYIGMQGNGTTATFGTYPTGSAPPNYGTNNQAGTFGTVAGITPTTTFVANKGPVMSVY